MHPNLRAMGILLALALPVVPALAQQPQPDNGSEPIDIVADSPVVPHGTSPDDPSAICQSTKSRKPGSSNRPSRKGVTSAGIDPENMHLSFPRNPRERITRP